MILYIAEKPSLAKAIFEGLGGNPITEKDDGFFQHNEHVVTWCVGHLMELFDPEDYDEKYSKWSFSDLPIPTVYPPTLKPITQTKSQFLTVKNLINKAETIVHAGDPDDEGQLLIDEVLNHVGNTKPVMRLLIADLNLAPVKKALSSMEPNEKYVPLGLAALARSISDQAFGYNLTRACTLKGREKGFQGVLNVGRVISAVLGLVNKRTLANQNHVKSYFYEVNAELECNGLTFSAKYIPKESDQIDEKNRLISEHNAKFISDATTSKDGLVTIALTKRELKAPPLPLNLSTLQQLCAKTYGYSATDTLKYTQALYETHKLLTYPRSDNRYLSDEHYYQAPAILTAIAATSPDLKRYCEDLQEVDKHKAFDASKIEAHHAIIPTAKQLNGQTLSIEEKNVYDLAAKYFIALFHQPSERDKTKVAVEVEGHQYGATQSVIVKRGWENIITAEKKEAGESKGIDKLNFNDRVVCKSTEVTQKETTPPKYFTESSLLAAMVSAAKFIPDPELRKQLEAKDKDSNDRGSIGTEATRASILEKLKSNSALITVESEKGYKELVWKTTKHGQQFCKALPDEITLPNISAIWADMQLHIKEGDLTVQEFVERVDCYIREQIEMLDEKGLDIESNSTPCPKCGSPLIRRKGRNGFFHGCSKYPECDASYPDKNGKPDTTPRSKPAVTNHQCPACSSPLVRRPAKKKGRYFFGCSDYPNCTVMLFEKKGKPDFESYNSTNRKVEETQ
ncbi:DNA topoisomerase 3 [Grimontia sp. SpTr1]|uniref:DNA topoisomerase 3 n=1 Tax=Grimontia sp. SpTr1 TaxID=2995319 RepID=UPI00248C38B4|nr:DNA topoisomerase 3 [Grimontia sp. SpTr1]